MAAQKAEDVSHADEDCPCHHCRIDRGEDTEDSLVDCLMAGHHDDEMHEGVCVLCGDARVFAYSDHYDCYNNGRHLTCTNDEGDCVLCGSDYDNEDEDEENEEEAPPSSVEAEVDPDAARLLLPSNYLFYSLFERANNVEDISKHKPRTAHKWEVPSNSFGGKKGYCTISSLCKVSGHGIEDYYLDVTPNNCLLEAVHKHMLIVDGTVINFDVIVQDSGKALVVAKYGHILGSRWISKILNHSIPGYESAQCEEAVEEPEPSKTSNALRDAIDAALTCERLRKKYCGEGSERHKRASERVKDTYFALTSVEKEIYESLLRTDEDGYRRTPTVGRDSVPFVPVVEAARKEIMDHVLKTTINMLNRRKSGEAPMVTNTPFDSRIWYVERPDRGSYCGYREESFVGLYVKLAVPVSGFERDYENIWFYVSGVHAKTDDRDEDALDGHVHSDPQLSELKRGDNVSFRLNEIVDVFNTDPTDDLYRAENLSSQSVRDIRSAFGLLTTVQEAVEIWNSLSDGERVHVHRTAEFINNRYRRKGH